MDKQIVFWIGVISIVTLSCVGMLLSINKPFNKISISNIITLYGGVIVLKWLFTLIF